MKTVPLSRVRGVVTILVLLVGLSAAASVARGAVENGFHLASGPVEVPGVAGIYQWRFEDSLGPSTSDRIALHRFAQGPRALQGHVPTVLYLPGTNMNGAIALYDPRYSFPVYLATRGVDVWAFDYRTHFVASTATAGEISDLFKGWTNEEFAADIATAANFISKQTGARKIFVAGFSRGVSFAYLFTAQHPQEVSGIVALDGFIPRRASQPLPDDHAVDDLAGKNLTWEKRQFLMEAVIANPDGPAPLPKYQTAGENLEHVVYDSKDFGGKGGLANPFDGYSTPVVLARMLVGYDRYWPAVQNYQNPFTPELRAALQASKVPVIAFASTNIAPDWSSWVVESAHATGSDDVTFQVFPKWGHLDVLCGTHAQAEVFAPTAAWLTRHQK
jgi:pimeloyl-ACP methyl ester carboxylesterase